MVTRGDLGSDVLALGELLGLLTPTDDDSATIDTAWFDDPASRLEQIDTRLHELVSIVDSILSPKLENPPRLSSDPTDPASSAALNLNWYPIPNPSTGGTTPFCLVASPPDETSGQIGLGASYPIFLGNLTIQAYVYVPLFSYSPSGAQFIADSETDPSQLGLYVTTSDSFTVSSGSSTAPNDTQPVTFTAMNVEAAIFLREKDPGFALTFLGGTFGPNGRTYTALSDLLREDVESWIAEVVVQGSYWLNMYVGSSATTVGEIPTAAHFLTQDDQGQYSLSLQNLHGQSAQQIALNFVFAGLDALATLEVPLVPLPGGGIYVASDEQTGDYGVRAAADLTLTSPQNTDGKSSPGFDVSLGTWFTGESDSTSWLARIAGGTPEPGLSVFLLRRDPATEALSFAPSFSLASVGINVQGSTDAPLVNLGGYTLQGAELRGYLASNGWDFGFGARLDRVGFPAGPGFQDTQSGSKSTNGSTSTNMVAKSLVASDGQASGGGQTNAVNPVFSAELGYVKGHQPLLELFDPQDAQTDLIWYPIQRRFGPLNCQKIGLKVDVTGDHASDPILGLVFDGGVQLAGLDVELEELSLSVHLKEIADVGGYDLDLQGLAIAFSGGSVEISGGLMRSVDSVTHFVGYDGEALVKFGGRSLTALGSFGSLPSGDTSMFIFVALSAPLGGPAFCFFTGLALGFGYNRGLKLPAEGDVQRFPLVAAMGDSAAIGGDNASPATVLATLEQWVPPVKGEYWLAAGVQFTSFEIINTNALLIVELGKELVISLLGIATLRQPIVGEAYVYAELDVEVIFAPQEGLFKASAVLAASSFVLTSQAHLTGGFAAYGWFGDNPHAGEFVFTLGGYHPAFKVPDYYPQEPRVGINWQIGGGLSMVGGVYLAITPTAMMAGGALQVTLEDGALRAWLKAQLDAILYYKPFHLTADASVSIGVSYRVNFLFVHKSISVEIGADFHLWGPPIGGTAHVNWYIISFTIGFGDDEHLPATLTWDEFKGMLAGASKPRQQPAPAPRRAPMAAMAAGPGLAAAAPAADPSPPPAYLTINAVAGLLRAQQVNGLTLWLVRPEQFEVAIGSQVPAWMGDANTPAIVVSSANPADDLTLPGTPVNMRGVNGGISAADYRSTQSITILALADDSVQHIEACMATTSPCTGRPAGCTDPPIAVTDWDVEAVQTQLPEAMWGTPVPPGQSSDVNSKTPTVAATTGVIMAPRAPVIANCTPEMVVDQIFDDRTVNKDDQNRLPLSQTAQPSTAVPAPADSFTDMAHVNDPATVEKRGALFAALQGLDINGWTNAPLPQMAAAPGGAFADEPLEGAPVPALVSQGGMP